MPGHTSAGERLQSIGIYPFSGRGARTGSLEATGAEVGEQCLGYLASRGIAGAQEEDAERPIHASSRVLRMTTAESGQAPRNSSEARSAGATASRVTRGEAEAREVPLGRRREQIDLANAAATRVLDEAGNQSPDRAPCLAGSALLQRSEGGRRPRRPRDLSRRRLGRRPAPRENRARSAAAQPQEDRPAEADRRPARSPRPRRHGARHSRLAGPHEGAHHATTHFAGQHLGIEVGSAQKRPRILELVDAGRLERRCPGSQPRPIGCGTRSRSARRPRTRPRAPCSGEQAAVTRRGPRHPKRRTGRRA